MNEVLPCRLRKLPELASGAVEAADIPGLPPGRKVTVTIGVAEAASGEALAATLARADQALYAGKAGRRNRVCVS